MSKIPDSFLKDPENAQHSDTKLKVLWNKLNQFQKKVYFDMDVEAHKSDKSKSKKNEDQDEVVDDDDDKKKPEKKKNKKEKEKEKEKEESEDECEDEDEDEVVDNEEESSSSEEEEEESEDEDDSDIENTPTDDDDDDDDVDEVVDEEEEVVVKKPAPKKKSPPARNSLAAKAKAKPAPKKKAPAATTATKKPSRAAPAKKTESSKKDATADDSSDKKEIIAVDSQKIVLFQPGFSYRITGPITIEVFASAPPTKRARTSRKKEENLDPDRPLPPKRPVGAFFEFCKKFKVDNDGRFGMDTNTQAALEWKKMDDEDKEPYLEKAKANKAKYDLDRLAYKKVLEEYEASKSASSK